MLGWYSSRCPLDLREKTWVELRMQWLIDQFGFERLRHVEIVTPSDAHFPEAYSGSDEDVERIFAQVCRQMGVLREAVEFEFFEGARPSGYLYDSRVSAMGLYEERTADMERHRIWIERSQVSDPLHLIATAAHELAHAILLGDKRLTSEEADHEFVTDLLTVVFGLGIFRANAAVVEETRNFAALSSSWHIAKIGYLPSRMYGYALAVFAWLREERHPAWASHLRADARSAFNSGLKYLRNTNECLCRSSTAARSTFPVSVTGRLTSENAGHRLTALWELRRPVAVHLRTDEWTAVVECLDHRDPIVVSETALAIAALDRADVDVIRRCVRLLGKHEDRSEVQSALALALGTQRAALVPESELTSEVVAELLRLLENASAPVVVAALRALGKLRSQLDALGHRQLWQAFRRGLVDCDDLLVAAAVAALHALCENPAQEAAIFFREDPELRRHARDALAMEFDEALTPSMRLPTKESQPVPLPGWRDPAVLTAAEQSEAPDE